MMQRVGTALTGSDAEATSDMSMLGREQEGRDRLMFRAELHTVLNAIAAGKSERPASSPSQHQRADSG